MPAVALRRRVPEGGGGRGGGRWSHPLHVAFREGMRVLRRRVVRRVRQRRIRRRQWRRVVRRRVARRGRRVQRRGVRRRVTMRRVRRQGERRRRVTMRRVRRRGVRRRRATMRRRVCLMIACNRLAQGGMDNTERPNHAYAPGVVASTRLLPGSAIFERKTKMVGLASRRALTRARHTPGHSVAEIVPIHVAAEAKVQPLHRLYGADGLHGRVGGHGGSSEESEVSLQGGHLGGGVHFLLQYCS